MILQWLNNGTKGRYALSGRNGSAREDYDSFILRTGGRGWRGSIGARNWFDPRSRAEMERAAQNLDKMIDDIITGVMY